MPLYFIVSVVSIVGLLIIMSTINAMLTIIIFVAVVVVLLLKNLNKILRRFARGHHLAVKSE